MSCASYKPFQVGLITVSLAMMASSLAPGAGPPTAEAVEEAIAAIESQRPFKSEDSRIQAYRMVAESHAAATKRGFRVLADGLSEPLVADICAKGLLVAPPEQQRDAAALVDAFLRTAPEPPKAKEGPGIHGVLGAISEMGSDGILHLDAVRDVLHDRDRGLRTRRAAAWAVLQILPLRDALENFGDLDPPGMQVTMDQLAEHLGESLEKITTARKPLGEFYSQEREALGIARRLILEGLQSPAADTRRAGLEAMTVAYGPEFVLIRSPDDYEVDPELRDILQGMARSDPEPDLRERAAKLLDPDILARRVSKILRSRESHPKQEGP